MGNEPVCNLSQSLRKLVKKRKFKPGLVQDNLTKSTVKSVQGGCHSIPVLLD